MGADLGATPHATSSLGRTGRRRTLGRELQDGNELRQSEFEDLGNFPKRVAVGNGAEGGSTPARWATLRCGLRVECGEGKGQPPEARLSSEEAATVFLDPLALTFPDPDHSAVEEREITIGYTGRQRIVLVSHCQRGDHTRIISARKPSKKERMQYEEGIDQETK